VRRVKTDADREELCEDSEQDELIAEEREESRDQHGVDVQPGSSDAQRTWQQGERESDADHQQHQPWIEEQPPRAEKEHESQVPPAVAPGPEMWRTRAAVGAQGHRHLGDAHALEGRLDHHLAGELHPCRLQAEPFVGVLAKAAQTAVHVTHRRLEEDATDERQHRVADPPVRPDHRAGLDAPGKPVADDEVVAVAEAVDKGLDRGEVVAVVGVAHDHEAPARGVDAADQRAPVSLSRDVDNAHAELACDGLRAVGAPVVGDDDLRRQAVLLDRLSRLADARGKRLDLVEARHDDRDLDRRTRARVVPGVRSLGDGQSGISLAPAPPLSAAEKEVTPTDRLSGAGTRPCGLIPAPSHVSLGAVEKGKRCSSNAQDPNIGSPPTNDK